jgi:Pentapeptide repeats (9 copies)
VDDLEPLSDPERKLLEAVQTGRPCDLSQDDDTDRSVRAAVLKAILSGEGEAWGISAGATIHLLGAVIAGDLGGFVGSRLPPIRLESCRFEDSVDFTGATFTGAAEFNRATFTGDAGFHWAIFTGDAEFNSATFTGAAEFTSATFTADAEFTSATFTGDAEFNSATFTGDARFTLATFASCARFSGTTFTGDARFSAAFTDAAEFNSATFTGDAGFTGAIFTDNAEFTWAIFTGAAAFTWATFTRDAAFNGATFTGDTDFNSAIFTGTARFSKVTFTGDARFNEATFTRDAVFEGALAHRLSFSRALFSAPDPGPWIASTISLDRTTMAVRSRISITATEIDASRFQAREGAHLVLHCARVDLSDSEFVRRSIVSSPPAAEQLPPRTEITTDQEARAVAAAAAKKFRDNLASELVGIPPRCGLTSLTRANIGELVLSDVVLDDCAFAGAHGLDKLRIGAGCSFRQTPRRWGRRRMVRRRVIAEELQWRAAHTRSRDESKDPEFLPAVEIAGIYRDLRKGLEDAKNEPGAADFYYGEMEMRRLAVRKPTEPGHEPADAASRKRGRGRSWAERILLCGYWAVSGYGLRASRALLTLVAVVAGAAMLYTMPAFATVTPPPAQIDRIDPTSGAVTYTPSTVRTAPEFRTALEYSARESISLLQARSMPAMDTTGVGTLLDFLLRLAGPVLLAFAVLALRARTKR